MKPVLCVSGYADFQENDLSLSERAKVVLANVLPKQEKGELSHLRFHLEDVRGEITYRLLPLVKAVYGVYAESLN